jgi:hypothetical protein
VPYLVAQPVRKMPVRGKTIRRAMILFISCLYVTAAYIIYPFAEYFPPLKTDQQNTSINL